MNENEAIVNIIKRMSPSYKQKFVQYVLSSKLSITVAPWSVEALKDAFGDLSDEDIQTLSEQLSNMPDRDQFDLIRVAKER